VAAFDHEPRTMPPVEQSDKPCDLGAVQHRRKWSKPFVGNRSLLGVWGMGEKNHDARVV
jgi:hypothetical protein